MKWNLMFLFAATVGFVPFAAAQQSVQQCVENQVREMMDEARKATSDREALAMMEAEIRKNLAAFQEDCQKEAAQRSAPRAVQPAPAGSETFDSRTESAPVRPGIGLKRKPAAAEPEFKDTDSTPDTGDRSLHGEGLGTSGDMRTTRTNALAGSWEFSSGLIDRSGSLAVAPVTITVINKSPCVMHTDGSLTLDKGTPAEEVFTPFSFSGVKIRPFGTFRKQMRIRLTNDKKHQLYGHIMTTFLFECPGS